MRFAKGHGTENDFVILLDPDGSGGLTADLTARLCDRRAGIGADGVLRAVRTTANGMAGRTDGGPGPAGGAGRPEWFMDYRNADGGVAEMCGNGIRVFARYLVRHGLAEGPEFTVATRSGPRLVRMRADGGVTVDMGTVAVLGAGSAVIAGQSYPGLRVSVGNPHLACLVDGPLAPLDLSRPPGLDPGQFPEGGNVELVRVTGPASVAMRVHERGSGETRSCGTGAVAAAAAAAAANGGDGTWDVRVLGGDLNVTLDGGRAWLTGPAVIVAEGELDPVWLAAGSPATADAPAR
ncbi:MAG TPA: diaminopimelate epimerase [Streptosporangiaceae bacterium]|nr:diaminopimelate epimerase [Streptosporangiaceae bacterium]